MEVGRTAFFCPRYQLVGGVLRVEPGWYCDATEPHTYPVDRHFRLPFSNLDGPRPIQDSDGGHTLVWFGGSLGQYTAFTVLGRRQRFLHDGHVASFPPSAVNCTLGTIPIIYAGLFYTSPEWFYFWFQVETAPGVWSVFQIRAWFELWIGGPFNTIQYHLEICNEAGDVVDRGGVVVDHDVAGFPLTLGYNTTSDFTLAPLGVVDSLHITLTPNIFFPWSSGLPCSWEAKPLPKFFDPLYYPF